MTLKIPDSGLLLEGPPSNKDSKVPLQAFAITLSDNVIESMIKCVQNGDDIELALGNTPTLLYGSHSHRLAPPPDSFPYELYLTEPFESTREAKRIRHTSSLFEQPEGLVSPPAQSRSTKMADDSTSTSKSKTSKSNKSSASSGLDSDLETLQNGLAAHDASRERTRMVSKPPTTKKGSGAAKGKLIPGYNNATPRSHSTSPALNAVRLSPEPGLSAAQQAVERKKEQRFTLVHELAVRDRTADYLRLKWQGQDDELQPTLEKVADYNSSTSRWTMKKAFWKELDVWNYKYDTQDERQTAIDNAVRQYDRQRISVSEPEWQKLLPKEDRGKGKSLSVLQASLAKKNTTADALTTTTTTTTTSVPRDVAEPMARSTSNPLPVKAKKPSAQEAQAKRLLGKSKPAAPQKPSPTKNKPAGTKANGGRVLSQEFIENSDSSGDEVPVVQSKPKPKPAPPKPAPAPAMKETVVVKPKPIIREPLKQQQASKRTRDDDESSSSSGTPLSKRFKDKQPLRPPTSTLKHRHSDAGQNSRNTVPATTVKAKATSPTKSSPLASSPPTNASDLENEVVVPPVTKKRKADGDGKMSASKRAQVSSDVMSQAHRFKMFYQKYEALHYEIAALDNPPDEKLADLIDMRGRLQDMKNEIYRQCGSDKE